VNWNPVRRGEEVDVQLSAEAQQFILDKGGRAALDLICISN
jgi:hypothetical protein